MLLATPLILYMVAFYALPVLAMLLRSIAEPNWTLAHYAARCPTIRSSSRSSGTRSTPR